MWPTSTSMPVGSIAAALAWYSSLSRLLSAAARASSAAYLQAWQMRASKVVQLGATNSASQVDDRCL